MSSSGVAASHSLYDLVLLLGWCCVHSSSVRCVCWLAVGGACQVPGACGIWQFLTLYGVSTGNHLFFFAGRFSNFDFGGDSTWV